MIWALLQNKNINPIEATIPQIASAILELEVFSTSQARNAYSALICFPPFQSLKFSPQLIPVKRKWSLNVQKYASFWDSEPVLMALTCQQLNHEDIRSLRDRLILSMRLLQLHRGVDLARSLRTISLLGPMAFMLAKRKGWKFHKWEQIINLPQNPNLFPWHLLQKYVALTADHGPRGVP